MPGRVTITATQVTDQQMATAEDVQRQEAVVIVVAVEEVTLLFIMQRRIGGIEVQDQAFGRSIMSVDKLLEQDLVNGGGGLPV